MKANDRNKTGAYIPRNTRDDIPPELLQDTVYRPRNAGDVPPELEQDTVYRQRDARGVPPELSLSEQMVSAADSDTETPADGIDVVVVADKTAEKAPKQKGILRRAISVFNPFNYFKRKQAAVAVTSAPADEPANGLEAVAASASAPVEPAPAEDAGIAYVEPAAEPEPVDAGIKFLDAEEPGAEPVLEFPVDLEESVAEETPMPAGMVFDGKYAPILMFAAGKNALVTEANKGLWEKTLKELDMAYAAADADKKKEAGEFRNYIFAVYAGADGCESKNKDLLVYVLSELAGASAEKGDHETAFGYARRAGQVGRFALLKAPTAESLHKWGLLEHNVEFYESQLRENTVTAEAE